MKIQGEQKLLREHFNTFVLVDSCELGLRFRLYTGFFTPLGAYRSQRTAVVAATNFHQLFGRFNGVIHCPDRDITVTDMYGFAERQYVKW